MRFALYATIWVALALLVVSEIGRRSGRLKPAPTCNSRDSRGWVWWAFATGAALTGVHVLIALAIQYNWDHEAAVSATALQAAEVYGFAWRGNIYVSYAFVALWLVEATRWRLNPMSYLGRSAAATWTLRLFFLMIIVNGAVIFATYPMRIAGIFIVAALLWAWLPATTRALARSPTKQTQRT